MATYEYMCLACETPFEERRPMTASVDTAIACPACGSERIRRRFSLFATSAGGADPLPRAGGGCGCGGSCVCGAH